jgi:hypothetical protein
MSGLERVAVVGASLRGQVGVALATAGLLAKVPA